jgi:hypothetical protein
MEPVEQKRVLQVIYKGRRNTCVTADIQGVSGGIENILGGGSMDYFE